MRSQRIKGKDGVLVKGKAVVEKFRVGEDTPYEVVESENNWFTAGWNEILSLITGASSDHYDATNTQIGVGNGTTAFSDAQTDLVGASTAYKGMESGYPTTPSSGTVQFKAKFNTSDANFAWEEWCVKNSSSGVVWNRAVSSLGTKSSSEIWYITVTMGKA
ncbi:MAG: hypothetical protein D6726_02880 [Nitrospirae bacterium]|nr:MAG: hypothetical protein D6726_02880 [Nitrospirota bacterium]